MKGLVKKILCFSNSNNNMHFKGWYFWKIRIVFTWELRNPDFIKIESQEGWTFLSAQPQQDHTLGAECTSGALIFLHWGAKALLSGAHWPDKRYALSSAAIWTYEMGSSSSVPSLRRNCFFFCCDVGPATSCPESQSVELLKIPLAVVLGNLL